MKQIIMDSLTEIKFHSSWAVKRIEIWGEDTDISDSLDVINCCNKDIQKELKKKKELSK